MLYDYSFSLWLKRKSLSGLCAITAMLYGNETRCLNDTEVAILRTERALLRAICGVKLMDKNTSELMTMLGFDCQ